MGVYEPLPSLDRWSPLDVARNIVNVVLDQCPEVSVARRQDDLNDQCDEFVRDLLDRWLTAKLSASDATPNGRSSDA